MTKNNWVIIHQNHLLLGTFTPDLTLSLKEKFKQV